MITQSNISTVDYSRAEELKFEGLLALTVVNTGFWPMLANDVLLKTGESYEFIKPDGTICNFNLTTKFIDGKGVFIEPAGSISTIDIVGNLAIFKDQWYNVGTEYFVQSVQENQMFEVLKRNDFTPLFEKQKCFQRQDGKNFVFSQHPDKPEFYIISEYIEYSQETKANSFRECRALFNYAQYFDPKFGTKSYTVISKRII